MAKVRHTGKRWRWLAIVLLIGGAALPALDGYLARRALRDALVARGVSGEQLIIAAGWRRSRALFPVPGAPALTADLRLYHGPYTGNATPGGAWGWLAAGGELRDPHGPVAEVQGVLRLGGRFSLTTQWQNPPAVLNSVLDFRSVTMTLDGGLFSAPAQLRIAAEALHWRRADLDIEIGRLALGADWPPAADQAWQLLADASTVALAPVRQTNGSSIPTGATAESGKLAIDWQPGLGELTVNAELHKVAGGGGTLDIFAFSGAVAPLDPVALGPTIAALPESTANPSLLFLPLLASRPVLTIERLTAAAGEQRFMLDGTLAPRPGGLSAQTHGGGAGEILEAVVRLYHFRRPLEPPAAATVLEQIRRQGWLQRRDSEWRADIVINF